MDVRLPAQIAGELAEFILDEDQVKGILDQAPEDEGSKRSAS